MVILFIKNLHLDKAFEIVQHLAFKRKKIVLIFLLYFSITIINAIIDSASVILLVSIFTGGLEDYTSSPLMFKLVTFFEFTPEPSALLLMVFLAFSTRLLLFFTIQIFDGVMSAKIRQRLQEKISYSFLRSNWLDMCQWRIGEAIGVNTMEAELATKYLTSVIKAAYFLITTLIMLLAAVWLDWKVTLMLLALVSPFVLILQWIFSIQSKLSKKIATTRKEFSADITERLHGYLHILANNNYDYYYNSGVDQQKKMTRLQILLTYCLTITGSFNIILPTIALLSIYIWSNFSKDFAEYIAIIASIGVLGTRISTQLNGTISSFGNLSRLSGSLDSVGKALQLKKISTKFLIDKSISSICLNKVNFKLNQKKILSNISLKINIGQPLVVSGNSGKGKTTLINLISGIYSPDNDSIFYVDKSGKKYNSKKYRTEIGYLTQDVCIFSGTVRDNLFEGSQFSDDDAWKVIKQVGAEGFVEDIGGLDGYISESGKSLSGGQKRRLGMARVLLYNSEVLIFDEVTSGLDDANKQNIQRVIEKLSKNKLVIIITHDDWRPCNSINFKLQ